MAALFLRLGDARIALSLGVQPCKLNSQVIDTATYCNLPVLCMCEDAVPAIAYEFSSFPDAKLLGVLRFYILRRPRGRAIERCRAH